jgi:hypothetical protein
MTPSPRPDHVVLPRGEKLALAALLSVGAVTIWRASRFFDFWFESGGSSFIAVTVASMR